MRLATLIAATLSVAAGPTGAAEFRIGQPVMGTVLQVTVIAEDTGSARRAAEAAIREAKHWDDVLTTWRPEGELAAFNRAAGAAAVPISPDLRTALEHMLDLTARTGGAFDPGVGPSVVAWRSGSSTMSIRPRPLPSSLRLEQATAHLGRGAELDAGAIGKGIALDAIARSLRKSGAHAAFLDFGGSSQTALGAPPDSPRGWTVALAGLEDGVVRGTITIRDASLSTSRTRPADAAEGAIIDPRSGAVVTAARAATVLHTRATEADAWSTALVVLGRDGIAEARAAGVHVFLEDRDGVVQTEGFRLDPAR